MKIPFKLQGHLLVASLSVLFYFSCDGEDSLQETVVEQNPSSINAVASNYYTPPTSFNVTKDLVQDYGVDNNFTTDDTALVQAAIDDINSLGGGQLTIPAGNYSFANVNLKSNVHLLFDPKAFVRPPVIATDAKQSIFMVGSSTATVENFSVTCSANSSKFKVDFRYTSNPNVMVFNLTNAQNFYISQILVRDNYSKFSSINFGITEYNGSYYWPHNGVVKDISVNDADYGYGVVQAGSASNVLFENLHGNGGGYA